MQVELSMSCSGLMDRDVGSKSDPTAILFIPGIGQKDQWTEYGRTEKIKDTINPQWQTKFVLDYRFEERQVLKFAIYDIDSKKTAKLSAHDSLGEVVCSLGEVVAEQSRGFTRHLGKARGTLHLQPDGVSASRQTVMEAKSHGSKNWTTRTPLEKVIRSLRYVEQTKTTTFPWFIALRWWRRALVQPGDQLGAVLL